MCAIFRRREVRASAILRSTFGIAYFGMSHYNHNSSFGNHKSGGHSYGTSGWQNPYQPSSNNFGNDWQQRAQQQREQQIEQQFQKMEQQRRESAERARIHSGPIANNNPVLPGWQVPQSPLLNNWASDWQQRAQQQQLEQQHRELENQQRHMNSERAFMRSVMMWLYMRRNAQQGGAAPAVEMGAGTKVFLLIVLGMVILSAMMAALS